MFFVNPMTAFGMVDKAKQYIAAKSRGNGAII
jgi:hypothetical protein